MENHERNGGGGGGSSAPHDVSTHPQTPQTEEVRKGDEVQIYSVSQKEWLAGHVEDIEDNLVTVIYTKPDGAQTMKVLPIGHEQLRTQHASSFRQPSSWTSNVSTGYPGHPASPAVAVAADAHKHFGTVKDAGLQGAPGIGVTPQADAILLVDRLKRHCDAYGLKKALARARLTGVREQHLSAAVQALKELEQEGDFFLFDQAPKAV